MCKDLKKNLLVQGGALSSNPQNFLIITRGKLITAPTYLFGQYEDEWWRENDEWRKNICEEPFFFLRVS